MLRSRRFPHCATQTYPECMCVVGPLFWCCSLVHILPTLCPIKQPAARRPAPTSRPTCVNIQRWRTATSHPGRQFLFLLSLTLGCWSLCLPTRPSSCSYRPQLNHKACCIELSPWHFRTPPHDRPPKADTSQFASSCTKARMILDVPILLFLSCVEKTALS